MKKYKMVIEIELEESLWFPEEKGRLMTPLEYMKDFVFEQGFDFDLTPEEKEQSVKSVEEAE
jgi:hypothetical protein